MKYHVSIIIPAYNEEKRLPAALRNTISFLKSQPYTSEIIVVNDGSKDGTKKTGESFAKDFPSLKVIDYNPNRGKGYAVKKGMLDAQGEYRLFMDADYAVPVEYLSEFLKLMDDDNKIIIGSRAVKGSVIETHQQFVREKLAKLFGVLQRFVLDLPIMDTQCGFKLFKAAAAEKLFTRIKYDCAFFDAELLYIAHHSGMKIEEIPVKWKHDMETRLPVGLGRSFDLLRKLFGIKKLHKLH